MLPSEKWEFEMSHSEICQSNRSRGFIFVDKQHQGKKSRKQWDLFRWYFFLRREKKSLIKIYCQTTVQLVARCKSCFLSFSFSLSLCVRVRVCMTLGLHVCVSECVDKCEWLCACVWFCERTFPKLKTTRTATKTTKMTWLELDWINFWPEPLCFFLN